MYANKFLRFRRCLAIGIAIPLMFASFAGSAGDPPKQTISRITGVAPDPNWQEEYAYTLGVQAYTFAFPWYYMQLLRWKWVTQPPANDRATSMPMNGLFHARKLTDATWKDGGSPNNDTLYSISFIDVGREPMIVSIPEMGERYYSVALTGFDSDNFGYIGKRATGSRAANYLIAGPNWTGSVPKGVRQIESSPTPMFFFLMRTLVDGPDDVANVHALQNQVKLTPLSQWGKKSPVSAEHRDVWSPLADPKDPMADWKTINRAMTENPPDKRYASLVNLFAKIGVGPGQDVDKVDEATRRGLLRALDAGKRVVTGAANNFAGSTQINGWRYFLDSWGHPGLTDDFIVRAGPQSLGGIATNDNVEAMYPVLTIDENGEQMSGAHRYVLTFAKGDLPPVRGFWSLTAYGLDFNMIDNPLNRYSLGDRAKGLQLDADGGLTLHVQKESPGKDRESNWLPVSDDAFFLIARMYLPEERAIKKQWTLPPLKRVE